MKLRLIILLLSLLPASAGAETLHQAYARALKDYYGGQYQRAVGTMERIRAIPMEHQDLHYNLGCAYFKQGQLGRAIFHFERTLALDPSADDAQFNLRTSRALAASKVQDKIKGAAQQPWWARLLQLLRARSWSMLFLVLWWLTFGVLVLLRYMAQGPARAGLIAANSFVALLAVICGALLLGRVMLDQRVTSGIVLPDRLEVREGPNAATKSSFKLHAGFKVRVQLRADGWMRIRLPNGLEGWVPAGEIGVL